MRRSAISIPSNIAEGNARTGKQDYIRFVSVAIGSLAELETQVILATDLNFINEKNIGDIINLILELQKMLYGLRKSLQPTT